MVSVLVTGATGGIGRSVVPLLAARGADVRATARRPMAGTAPAVSSIRFMAADLSSDDLAPLVAGVSVVVHLAARSSPWGPRAAFVADNVRATTRLLDAAAAAGATRFVHASTPAIFAERRHRLDLRADAAPAAMSVNLYAETKLEAERIVRAERRMTTMVLRPSAVIGPDDRAILPRLMRVLRRGVLPVGNGGAAVFHPTDVRDAAAAFVAAALGAATGVVNLAGREPVAVVDMARALAARLSLAIRVRQVPEPALHGLATALEVWGGTTGREPPLTRYSAALLSWSRTFDLDETAAILGCRPLFGPDEMLVHAVPR